eukprot:2343357-Rhodomonas_salina.1
MARRTRKLSSELLLLFVLSYVGAALDITSVQKGNHLATGGLVISVLGGNFTVSAAARAGPTACESTAWVSASSVQCILSSGISESLAMTVSVAGGVVTVQAAVSFDAAAVRESTLANTNNDGGRTMT